MKKHVFHLITRHKATLLSR